MPIALGFAYTEKLKKSNTPVICILGDGELQEGQTWESIQTCVHHKIDNLWAIMDVNDQQCVGAMSDVMDVGDIAKKIESFGAKAIKIEWSVSWVLTPLIFVKFSQVLIFFH